MWIHLAASLFGALLLVASLGPPPSHKIRTAIYGGGIVNATDDFGGYFPRAGNMAINAGIKPDGTPYGSIKFVGYGEFASAWGACPFDPRCEDFPNTSTDIFVLNGRVTGVTAIGDTVQINGLVSETDYETGNGVIFHVDNDPFVITAAEGSNSFVLQFCLVPPFTMDMAHGKLLVRSADTQTALLQRPVQTRTTEPMPCHAPRPGPGGVSRH